MTIFGIIGKLFCFFNTENTTDCSVTLSGSDMSCYLSNVDWSK